ncbi:hypothetical protein [Streptomyces sp. NPDC050548]|uniref:hypothetical protein n=1 Tax=Streptomyces sp. NPDC050548 TaxID=3365629 RepID=UPI0037AD4A4F
MSDLFFPPDDPNKFVSPGVLLDNVIKRIGHTGSRSSFDRLRRQEFEEFGAYLVAFVNAEAEQVNERIKVDRVQEKADKERIEAERFKKEAKEQKKRAKKEPAKGHVQTEEDGKRASGKAQESSRRTPDERKRRMQLAREKFIRQQQRRKEEQAKTRKRNLVIFCAVYALIATLVISYEVAPEHFPAWMSSTSWPKWLGG